MSASVFADFVLLGGVSRVAHPAARLLCCICREGRADRLLRERSARFSVGRARARDGGAPASGTGGAADDRAGVAPRAAAARYSCGRAGPALRRERAGWPGTGPD